MTPQRFAEALVARIQPVVPDGFVVRAEGDHVRVVPPEGTGTSASLGYLDPGEADADDYADAAWNVLSMVQDAVSEYVAEPWPSGAGDDVADPGTRADAGVVRLWFGDETAPVVVLEAIPLD